MVDNYHNGDWEAWTSKYADTAKIYYNNWDNAISAAEAAESHKQSIAQVSSYQFEEAPIYYEMIIDDEGKTWVNFWGNWKGTLSANGKEISLPVHLTINIKDGKIVEEYGFWDTAGFSNALAEIEAMRNAPETEQAILTNQAKIAEAWSKNDVDTFKALTSANLVRNTNGVKSAGNQGEYIELISVFHTAFPDFNVVIDNYFLKDGKSYMYWTCTGTNTGEFMGNAPTGKAITTHGMSVWTFNDDGIAVREDAFYDNMELYNQLGYTLSPPQAE